LQAKAPLFFLLSNEESTNTYAELVAVETIYKPADIKSKIEKFLAANNLNVEDINLVITGKNGDVRNDVLYEKLNGDLFKDSNVISYKHLSGEYPTASSFAVWMAANILKQQKLPKCFADGNIKPKALKKILIYNSYQSKYHSLMLLSKP
jgi:3-oxoacyl-[acyl-carrier-protein] synthase II